MRKLVMVVDDNHDIRNALAEAVKDGGYEAALFANGLEAFDYLTEGRRRPDVILLDMLMPVMDGQTFLEQVSGRKELDGIPIAVLSASVSNPHELHSRATGYLRKPFSLSELDELLAKLLSS